MCSPTLRTLRNFGHRKLAPRSFYWTTSQIGGEGRHINPVLPHQLVRNFHLLTQHRAKIGRYQPALPYHFDSNYYLPNTVPRSADVSSERRRPICRTRMMGTFTYRHIRVDASFAKHPRTRQAGLEVILYQRYPNTGDHFRFNGDRGCKASS